MLRLISGVADILLRKKGISAHENIAVLGASLSAQTVNHKTGELTGYVEAFRQRCKKEFALPPEQVIQFAYGGNRLSDAGLIRLEEVIEAKPSICIVEPIVEDVSRGSEADEAEYLYVFKKLIANNILPVVFCVPLPLIVNVRQTQRYKACRKLCEQYQIPILTVDLDDAVDSGVVFDGLHTRSEGAIFVANALFEFMRELPIKQSLKRLQSLKSLPPSSFAFKRVDTGQGRPWRSLQFAFHVEKPFRLKVLQRQNIGPFSPVLNVSTIDPKTNVVSSTKKVSVWDRYCYYQRSSFVVLCDLELSGESGVIKIEVANDAPDYKKCSKFSGTWPSENERRLEPISPLFMLANCQIEVAKLSMEYIE
tara:strand:+ start:12398 stop:13492 length:1095 start_codon:yes stop_codon:yes gene_type:complete